VQDAIARSGGLIRCPGAITDPAALLPHLHNARGFVLPSTQETQSTAALAAAAAGLPLLLTDLPWARETFGTAASYLPKNLQNLPTILRQFFDSPPPATFRPTTWDHTAQQLLQIFQKVLAGP
jgi:glycosyltransferase involved in cell wall biosynthesis